MYGLAEYAGALYGGPRAQAPAADDEPTLAVEVSFTTGALDPPVWVDITPDVRSWDTLRGRNRELERFQPGRATVVLSNLERQYDTANPSGPWAGNLRPMRRIRIRETFSGVTYPVFDGYIDRWQLDYPGTGKDATATVIATDLFKVVNRALFQSVYDYEVRQDEPAAWWRLGNAPDVATAADTAGARHLAYVDNPRGGQPLVARDPNPSTFFDHPDEGDGNVVEAASTMPVTGFPFTVEAVIRSAKQADNLFRRLVGVAGNNSGGTATRWLEVSIRDDTVSDPGKLHFALTDDAGVTGSVTVGATRVDDGRVHHVAVVVDSATFATIYLDGVDDTAFDAPKAVSLPTGTVQIALGNIPANDPNVGEFGLDGELQDVAFYDEALSATRIAVHADAVANPWQDDLPGERAGRILDIVGWPADLRDLDDGGVALQSAQLTMTALEHLHKIGETEFGLMFASRTGTVRLIDQDAIADRDPQGTFGDGPGETGYRSITFDDGDTVIRNRATISRLDGAAKTAVAPDSVSEFGRFDYTLEGLFHRLDSYSQEYADLIVGEYDQPRRRVTSLELGPPIVGAEADLYPQILGREIGDAVTVINRPPGGGGITQTCVIEGIEHAGTPKTRTCTWRLSPEFGAAGHPDALEGALLAEDGDTLTTESGDTLTLEQ